MRRLRVVIAAAGVLLVAYGAFGILSRPDASDPLWLAVWFAAAIAVHDGVIAPATLLLGLVLTRTLPPRGRRYVQGGLVASALVAVVALPLIYREGTQPVALVLLLQDYTANLALLVLVISIATAIAYAARVRRDRSAATGARPRGRRSE